MEYGVITGESQVASYIDQRFVRHLTPLEGKTNYVARRVLQTLGVTIALIARIPFIAINLKLGGDSLALGILLSVGNLGAVSCLISWSILNIINNYLSPEEKELSVLTQPFLQEHGSQIAKAIFVFSLVVGVFSQLPFAFLGYTYNDKSLLMFALILMSDSWVPTNSVDLNLKALLPSPSCSPELVRVREAFNRQVKGLQQDFVRDPDVRGEFLRELDGIREGEERVRRYVSLIATRTITEEVTPPWYSRALQWVIWSIGFVCMCGNLISIGYVGYNGAKLIFDEAFFSIGFGLLASAANLYINKLTVPTMAVALFNLLKDLLLRQYSPTLVDQFYPKLSGVSKFLGFCIGSLTFGPSLQVAKDFFGFNSAFSHFMQVTAPLGISLLVLYAITETIDKILQSYVLARGTEAEKAALKCSQDFEKLSRIIQNCSGEELEKFAAFLPDESRSDSGEEESLAIEIYPEASQNQ